MHFLSRLAKALEHLRRAAYRYHDSDLKDAVSELYRVLATVVNIAERVYGAYLELHALVKTDLKLDGCDVIEDAPSEGERLEDYVKRLVSAGRDPNRALAYLLSAGLARVEVLGGEVYLTPLCGAAGARAPDSAARAARAA
jgi:hypothetical protein